jgi:hypothetical protein
MAEMTRTLTVAYLAILAIALSTMPFAPARAEFGKPFWVSSPVAPPSFYYGSPQVAVDASGNAVFTWGHSNNETTFLIEARARAVSGVLGPIQTLSGVAHRQGAPKVAVDADGDAIFAWERLVDGSTSRSLARTLSAAGVIGPLQTLSKVGASNLKVAVDPDGDAVFSWDQTDKLGAVGIRGRTLSAAGVLGAALTLSEAGFDASTSEVAVDFEGDALFTWHGFDGTNLRIQARTLSATGVLGAIEPLSEVGENAHFPQVAVDADGDAVFAWRFVGTNGRIQARTRSAAGVLGAIETLSEAGEDVGYDHQVAVDADGDAVFTWVRSDYPSDGSGTIQARTLSAAGVLGPILYISEGGDRCHDPQVAIGPDGNAVFTWMRASRRNKNQRPQARTLSPAGVLGPIQTLSRKGGAPRVAVGASGSAVVVWLEPTDNGIRVRAAVGP